MNIVKRIRVEIAVFLLKRGYISFGKATEIADMNIIEFLEELKRRKIKPFEAVLEDIQEMSEV